MANEITFSYMLSVQNPTNSTGVSSMKTPPQMSITQAAQGVSKNVLSVTTANLALSIGNISTIGVCWVTNLDATNFVDVGQRVAGNFSAFLRVKAGESWPFRMTPGVVPYAQANTATVKIEYEINEN